MTSQSNAHRILHTNLLLLQKLVSEGPKLSSVHEGMFAQANRAGFENVIHFLLHSYDSEKTKAQLLWPIVERSRDERVFRKNVVLILNDIAKDIPEAWLPKFSPSFLTLPGGDRFANFMAKLSVLVLKVVLERSLGEDYPILQYPTRGLNILRRLNETSISEIKQRVNNLGALMADAFACARAMCKDITTHNVALKKAQQELSVLVEELSNTCLSDVSITSFRQLNQDAFKEWRSRVKTEGEDLKNTLSKLKDKSQAIRECCESVKVLADSQDMPLKLGTTHMQQESLNFAELFSETSKVVSTLQSLFSECGGLPFLNGHLPLLNNLRDQLDEMRESFCELNSGFMDLICDVHSGVGDNWRKTDVGVTPSVKVQLSDGYKMLEEVAASSPSIYFDAGSEQLLEQSITSESPIVCGDVVNVLQRSRGERRRMPDPRRLLPSGSDSSLYLPTPRRPDLPFQQVPYSKPSSDTVRNTERSKTPNLFSDGPYGPNKDCQDLKSLMEEPYATETVSLSIGGDLNSKPVMISKHKEEKCISTANSEGKKQGLLKTGFSQSLVRMLPNSSEKDDDGQTIHAQNICPSRLPVLGVSLKQKENTLFGNGFGDFTPFKETCGNGGDRCYSEQKTCGNEFDSPMSSSGISAPSEFFEQSSVLAESLTPEVSPYLNPSLPNKKAEEIEGSEKNHFEEPCGSGSAPIPAQNSASRRKSLQAIIDKYKQLMANRQPDNLLTECVDTDVASDEDFENCCNFDLST